MKKSLFLVFTLITSFSYSKAEEIVKTNNSILEIYPESPVQGQQLMINYKLDDYTDTNIEFNDKKYKLFAEKVFIPVSPEIKSGEYYLKIKKADQELTAIKIQIKAKKFGKQNISYYKPKLSIKAEEKIKEEDNLVELAKSNYSEEVFWDKSFILPVGQRVSDIYGTKRYLNGKYNGFHSGVDFASPFGVPVKAINNAKVNLAQYFSKYNSNGNIVFLDHGLGVGSVYLHLSKIAVKEGQKVKRGDTIGYVGSTGRSTGPHLHWGVYLYGQNTDGLAWIKLTQKLFK